VPGYTATDAVVSVNGVTYTRNNNNIKDVIPGVTLELKATNTSLNANGVNVAAPASLVLARDNTAIETKVDSLVTAYNDLNDILTQVGDPKSTLQTYGGTLVADSTVSLIRNQVRKMMLGVSSTAGTNVGALWQMGLSIDQKGVLSKDATKFSAALTNNYGDVVKTFTGNQENQSIYSPVAAGLAGDAVKSLTKMLSATGPIVTRSDGATKENTKYTSELATLKTRMDALLTRYTKQFSTMDSLVGNINSMKASLTSTFNAMNNSNSTK
jgi:flagellar hook-associated protein 2